MVPLRSWSTVGLVAVLTFGVTALLGVLGGGPFAAATAVTGWFIVVPILAFLTARKRFAGDDGDDEAAADPLETLRDRYARGELTEAEFERRLDRLLETERSQSRATERRDRREREPVRER